MNCCLVSMAYLSALNTAASSCSKLSLVGLIASLSFLLKAEILEGNLEGILNLGLLSNLSVS